MFCKNCGKEIADDAKFCDKCGCQVDGAESGLAEDPVLWRNIAIVVAICLAALLAVAIYNHGGIAVGVAFGR